MLGALHDNDDPANSMWHTFKSVLISAEEVGGNYGSSYYGLSAVRFVMKH